MPSAKFTAVFSEPIDPATFTVEDVVLTGTATGKTVKSVTQVAPNDGTTFQISTSATGQGTIVADIPPSNLSYISSVLGSTGTYPSGISVDSSGNVFTANTSSNNVSKITPEGSSSIIGTINSPRDVVLDRDGNAYVVSGSGYVNKYPTSGSQSYVGSSTGYYPTAIALDENGNIYVSNNSSSGAGATKITSSGVATSMGSGQGPVFDIAVDLSGNVYVPNYSDNNVTKFNPDGSSSILGNTGPAPFALAVDLAGNVYVLDTYGTKITKITTAGVSSTFATVSGGQAIAIDAQGNIYVPNVFDGSVRKVNTNGSVSTIGSAGSEPRGITVDSTGNVYISNSNDNTVTKLSPTLLGISDLAGNGNLASTSSDNTVTYDTVGPTVTINQKSGQADPTNSNSVVFTATFSDPIDPSTFTADDIELAGTATGKSVSSIEQVSPIDGTTFEVTVTTTSEGTVIANIPQGWESYGSSVYANTGDEPIAVATDNNGNVYVANYASPYVTKISPIGGTSQIGDDASDAIAVDTSGNVFFTRASGGYVKKISPSGETTTLSSTQGSRAIAVDLDGNVYIPNSTNSITKITPSGVTTSYGTTGSNVQGIVVDSAGNVYTANAADSNVSKITPSGVSTILGTTGSNPYGIVVDEEGSVFVTNAYSNSVSKITQGGVSTVFASGLSQPRGLTIDNAGYLYTANYGGQSVSKITPQGEVISLSTYTGGSYPTGIALDSVGNVIVTNRGSDNVTKIVTNKYGVLDLAGNCNEASTFTDRTITIDTTKPSVVINQKSGQPDPTNSNAVTFTAVFSEPINPATFTTSQIALDGSAYGKTVASVTEVSPYDGTTFEIVATASGDGTISASIAESYLLYDSSTFWNIGTDPSHIAVDSLGNVYVANLNSNNVTKFTPQGGASIIGSTGQFPIGIAVDQSGNVYTANGLSNNVTKITPEGVSSVLGTTGNFPWAITVDQSGNVYTANVSSNDVSKITPDGVSSILGTTGDYPWAIALDSEGNIFTANTLSGDVSKITPSGVSTIFATIGEYSALRGIAIDEENNIYVPSLTYGNVSKITSSGTVTLFGTTGSAPSDIAVDGDGNVFTANRDSENVSRITPFGNSTIIAYTGSATAGIALDNGGNIFTSNYGNNSISKFYPTSETGVTDLAGNGNLASTSSDNVVTYDGTAPSLYVVTGVPSQTNDTSPDFTFYSNEAGTISYSGDCSSYTMGAFQGYNTVTFDVLSSGTHSNCAVSVTDATGNVSTSLDVGVFLIGSASAPTVSTGNLSSVDRSEAYVYVEITADGGLSISNLGVEYGTTSNYGSTSTYGSAYVGSFQQRLSGLSCATTYHYRAFATNAAGTSYGNDLTFTTEPCLEQTDLRLRGTLTNTSPIKAGDTAHYKLKIKNIGNGTYRDAVYFYINTPENTVLDSYNMSRISGSSISPAGGPDNNQCENDGPIAQVDGDSPLFNTYRGDLVVCAFLFTGNEIEPGQEYSINIDLQASQDFEIGNSAFRAIVMTDENQEPDVMDIFDLIDGSPSPPPIFSITSNNIINLIYGDTSDMDGDGIPDQIELGAPNSGDANGDGIADIDQDNVTSFIDAVSGSYGVLESTCVRNEEVSSMVEPVGNSDSNYSYPSGLVNFSLACGAPGATATVTQYFYGLSDPSILVARKYDPVSHQYSTIQNASITSTVVGGMTVVKVVYQITDGGAMDEDGTIDGNIVDPSGPAYVQSGSSSGSGGTATSKTGKVPSFAKPRSGGIPSLAALQNAPSEEVSITKDRSLLKAPYSSEKVKAKESNAKLGDDHSDRNKNFLYTIGASVVVIFLSFGFRFWFARRRKKQEEQISELEVIKF